MGSLVAVCHTRMQASTVALGRVGHHRWCLVRCSKEVSVVVGVFHVVENAVVRLDAVAHLVQASNVSFAAVLAILKKTVLN